ncbi:MAG: ABC transporter permease subunit [Thermoplasmatota archaeon]
MPEGAHPYPRWQGQPSPASRLGVILWHEVRMANANTWSRLAMLGGLAWGVASIIQLAQYRQLGDSHDTQSFLSMLDQLRWAVLLLAAASGGASLIEDARQGALELTFTRAVTPGEYLAAKALAQTGLATAVLALPAVAYYGASFLFYTHHPAGWEWALPLALGYSLLWGLVAAGLALGLSCVSRSSLTAALVMAGTIAGLDIVVGRLLASVTNSPRFTVLSPLAALSQVAAWMFHLPLPYKFPTWWATVEVAGLLALGWGLVWWRHPRPKGV